MSSLDIWGGSGGRRRKKQENLYDLMGAGTTKIKPLKITSVSYPYASGYEKSEGTRDSRRIFASRQKNEILAQQNNKCAVCHNPLDPRTKQFDHKKPWADRGKTIVQNGRALCPNCHSLETHKHGLKKTDKKRRPKDQNLFGGGLKFRKNPWL